jgi:hypothetical protein
MKNLYHLSLIAICVCALFSCKKDEIIGEKTQKSSYIVGKWLVYQQETKIYDLNSNELLKDTVITYSTSNFGQAWYQIYNTDGSAYITSTPYIKTGATTPSIDTTAYLHYSVLVSNYLKLSLNGGGTETDPILNLTQTDLELEKKYNSTPKTGWGLDTNTSYLIAEDSYYTKQ